MTSQYNKRYVSNIVIEAVSPLKIGSSDVDMLQDSSIQKDWNGLPMILGTSIAGVLRKSFDTAFANDIFGDEDSKKKDAKGSRIIISNALLCDENMKVHEGLGLTDSLFLQTFESLPLREHVKITHKGVTDSANGGKFDEEVVYKGSRFIFRIELIADEKDNENWQELLKYLNTNTFRLGGGSTKGFGDVVMIDAFSSYDVFDLSSRTYSEVSSSLSHTFDTSLSAQKYKDENYTTYQLNIEPDDFFMFGSGFGDDNADLTPVKEKIVIWEGSKGRFTEEQILMPASSLKGAIAHRTAYYYNLKKKLYIGNPDVELRLGAIFGEAKESDSKLGKKGKVLFSDIYKVDKGNDKVFDHVSIDRFTGGAIEGALFQEKTIAQKDMWHIEILLKKDTSDITADHIMAFESALKDVTTGMLSLGGTTMKGHGVFAGEVLKDGELL